MPTPPVPGPGPVKIQPHTPVAFTRRRSGGAQSGTQTGGGVNGLSSQATLTANAAGGQSAMSVCTFSLTGGNGIGFILSSVGGRLGLGLVSSTNGIILRSIRDNAQSGRFRGSLTTNSCCIGI